MCCVVGPKYCQDEQFTADKTLPHDPGSKNVELCIRSNLKGLTKRFMTKLGLFHVDIPIWCWYRSMWRKPSILNRVIFLFPGRYREKPMNGCMILREKNKLTQRYWTNRNILLRTAAHKLPSDLRGKQYLKDFSPQDLELGGTTQDVGNEPTFSSKPSAMFKSDGLCSNHCTLLHCQISQTC